MLFYVSGELVVYCMLQNPEAQFLLSVMSDKADALFSMEIPELPLPLCEINTAQKTEGEGEGTGRKTDPFSDAFPGVSLC